jgi:hypothetical protein
MSWSFGQKRMLFTAWLRLPDYLILQPIYQRKRAVDEKARTVAENKVQPQLFKKIQNYSKTTINKNEDSPFSNNAKSLIQITSAAHDTLLQWVAR